MAGNPRGPSGVDWAGRPSTRRTHSAAISRREGRTSCLGSRAIRTPGRGCSHDDTDQRKAARSPMDPWGSILGSLTTGVDPKAVRASSERRHGADQGSRGSECGGGCRAEDRVREPGQACDRLRDGARESDEAGSRRDCRSVPAVGGPAARLRTGLTGRGCGRPTGAGRQERSRRLACHGRARLSRELRHPEHAQRRADARRCDARYFPRREGVELDRSANATYAVPGGRDRSIAQEYMQKGSDLDAEVAAKNAALQASAAFALQRGVEVGAGERTLEHRDLDSGALPRGFAAQERSRHHRHRSVHGQADCARRRRSRRRRRLRLRL
jgi:hypothetical protein